jgi:predicted MFS family arabinose efflux permease
VLGGPALAFGVAALAHWTFAIVLLFVHGRPSERPKERPRVFGGLRYLLADRNAGLLMLGVAALGLGADPVVTLTPSLADQLGGGGEVVGVLATCFGVGSVVLTLLVRPLRRRLTLRMLGIAGFWVLAAGLGVAAAGVAVPIAAAGFLLAGAGFMMATVALNTRIQRRVPDELRGRVMALWGVAFLGSRPFAALINGSIADLASVEAALLAAAVLTLLASLLARVSYASRPAQS